MPIPKGLMNKLNVSEFLLIALAMPGIKLTELTEKQVDVLTNMPLLKIILLLCGDMRAFL